MTARIGALPPGPANPVRSTAAFQRSPLGYISDQIAIHGDLFSFRLATLRLVVVTHPHHVKWVMQDNAANYDRDTAGYKVVRNVFGEGLATIAGGPEWRRQRRLVKPSFHHQRVAAMSEHMSHAIDATIPRWEKLARAGEPLRANEELRRLTLRIAARALFALDDERTTDRFAEAVDIVERELSAHMQFPLVPLSVPTAGHRRFRTYLQIIEEILDYVIVQHFYDDIDRGDLLSTLIRTEDAGERMTERQLRDEVFVLLFAGHETSANVLTWLWYLLGQHPTVQDRVRNEIDHELGGAAPTIADCRKLAYTRQVLDETMRLYPQQWHGSRHAIEDDEIGGYRIPAGTDIMVSNYHMHRHPDFWDEPDTFRPERFAPEEASARDRSTHNPFGAGPHMCVGNQFALTEMLLITATVMQRFHIELTDTAPVDPKPLLTLGPASPVHVRLKPRR